jgi:hypothetical protein
MVDGLSRIRREWARGLCALSAFGSGAFVWKAGLGERRIWPLLNPSDFLI